MISIGKSELLLSRIYSPEEILELIDSVKMDDVNHIINTVFDEKYKGAAIIGPNGIDSEN